MFSFTLINQHLVKLIAGTAISESGNTSMEIETKTKIVFDNPILFMGNADNTEKKQSLTGETVPQNQQWIEFIVDFEDYETNTKYSEQLLGYNAQDMPVLQLYKYQTRDKKTATEHLHEPLAEGFNFSKSNVEIKRQPGEDFKYVVSIRSEKGQKDNLYDKFVDESNKDAACEMKLRLQDENNVRKFLEFETSSFRIDTSKTPHAIVNSIFEDPNAIQFDLIF